MKVTISDVLADKLRKTMAEALESVGFEPDIAAELAAVHLDYAERYAIMFASDVESTLQRFQRALMLLADVMHRGWTTGREKFELVRTYDDHGVVVPDRLDELETIRAAAREMFRMLEASS